MCLQSVHFHDKHGVLKNRVGFGCLTSTSKEKWEGNCWKWCLDVNQNLNLAEKCRKVGHQMCLPVTKDVRNVLNFVLSADKVG